MIRDVHAVICAHTEERWVDLGEAIASLKRQTLPPARIILVVDHNPTLLTRARAAYRDVDVMANLGPRGLSGARNTGLSRADAPFVAFLDDDAVAGERFLELLAQECGHPGVLGATSRVEPIWLDTPPRWLPRAFSWTIGCTSLEPGPVRREVRNVSGGAALYRRDVFAAVGGFSTSFGRDGSTLPLSCEETELCIRASRHFTAGRFVQRDDVSVGHKVSGSRLTFGYFTRRCFAEGISKHRLSVRHHRVNALRTERAYLLKVLGQALLGHESIASGRSGIAPAVMAIVGLTAAGAGFLAEMIMSRLRYRSLLHSATDEPV